MAWDPALVVVLVSAGSGGAGGLVAGGGLGDDLGVGSLLGLALDGLGALGLGEEGLDPGLVDEVGSSAKDGGEDEVQKDAVCFNVY